MAITATKLAVLGNPSTDQDQIRILLLLTLSGNYGGAATHGDTLSFSGIDEVKSGQVPNRVEIFESPAAGTAPAGYQMIYCPGTTRDNGVVYFGAYGGAEYAEGTAYDAGHLAAVIYALAVFPAFV